MNRFAEQRQQNPQQLFLIAGPCVIESETHALHMAEAIAAIAERLAMSSKPPTTKPIALQAARFAAWAWRKACASLQKSKLNSGCPC
jgi:3-deoxy-D-arabino-heptulosonate 7-phosphate (DAHP) synthase